MESHLQVQKIGSTILFTPFTKIKLNEVLLVHELSRNLLSVAQLTHDNHCSIEFSPCGFCIKDLLMLKPILQGPVEQGFYPI